ncbi:hypothetical protein [Pseudoalteromonas mariniglutinosa]|uniref:hypothetical protein n=1 Tax=Pseudoalteromonas mariniglutinosa TaxID=206042 RepID=UPI00384BCBB4
MEIITAFQTGIRNGIANNGHTVYCRYGLPYLVCLPINKPDDPLLNPAIDYFKALDGYFAQQFFLHLHPTLNSADVLSIIYQYASQTPSVLAELSHYELMTELANFVKTNKLQVIPLYD